MLTVSSTARKPAGDRSIEVWQKGEAPWGREPDAFGCDHTGVK